MDLYREAVQLSYFSDHGGDRRWDGAGDAIGHHHGVVSELCHAERRYARAHKGNQAVRLAPVAAPTGKDGAVLKS